MIGVRGGVGGDDLGLGTAIEVEHRVEHVQAVAFGAGDDDGADTGNLVIDGVEPRQPPAAAEVLRVRCGGDRLDWDDES